MENLPLFFRFVRESQGFSQTDLADKVNLSQSAIAQFEKSKSEIKNENLLKIASILNLNPEYVQYGIGNPFRQFNINQIIKMVLPEDPMGKSNFYIPDMIVKHSKKVFLFLLRPPARNDKFDFYGEQLKKERSQWKKQKALGNSIYAFIMQDEDNNMFIFKRENNQLINEKEFLDCIKKEESSDGKLDINTVPISLESYLYIKSWEFISSSFIIELIKNRYASHRYFSFRLISYVWSHGKMAADNQDYKKIREKIDSMSPDKIDNFLDKLIPDIAKSVRRYI